MDKNDRNFGIEFLNKDVEYCNIEEIIESLKQEKTQVADCVKTALLKAEFVLNRQEMNWLHSHEKHEWSEYLIFRYKFRNYANWEKETEYPVYVVIEPSSACNLQCVMCFQQDPELKRKAGMMQWDVFEKIIDELAGSECKAITIAGRGEPLLNNRICEMLDYLNGKFLEIKLNTNGLLMNEEVARSILRNNVNVVFSAEGSNAKEYEQIRCNGNFEKLVQNVKIFNSIREKEFSGSTTKTRVSGVAFDSIDKRKYQEFWSGLVDEVVVVEYEERKDTYNNEINCVTKRCARLWQSVYVWYNGEVSPCDIDYLNKLTLGNVMQEKICDIWNGKQLTLIREIHKTGKRCQLIPCNQCEGIDI